MEMLHGLCSDPRAVKRCAAVNPDTDTHDDVRARQVSLLIQAALVIAVPIQEHPTRPFRHLVCPLCPNMRPYTHTETTRGL